MCQERELMRKRFIFSDKAVNCKPVNPDFIIAFEKAGNESYPSRQGKYHIIFAAANVETKTREVVWTFELKEDRDEVYNSLKCSLSESF